LRTVGALLRALVAVAVLMQECAARLGAPLWRWVGRLRLLASLARAVERLPPYGVLAALAAPFLVAEPMKAAGLYALATGRIAWGVGLQAAGHALSLLLVERILHAGLPQLLTLPWFAGLWTRFVRLRAAVTAWLDALGLPRLVAAARGFARHVREAAGRAAGALARRLPGRPRG
jgi:hypothetical protein